MANDSLLKLFNKLESDPELIKKAQERKTPEELYKFCTSIVGGYTFEEFDKVMKAIAVYSKIYKVPEGNLDKISGGNYTKITRIIQPKGSEQAYGGTWYIPDKPGADINLYQKQEQFRANVNKWVSRIDPGVEKLNNLISVAPRIVNIASGIYSLVDGSGSTETIIEQIGNITSLLGQ